MKYFKLLLLLCVGSLAASGAFADEKILLPIMVKVPGGKFETVTCPEGVKICPQFELVEREVEITSFEMATTEVTFAQWDQCIEDGGCVDEKSDIAFLNRPTYPPCIAGALCQYPYDQTWGRGNRPVINVNWDDIQKYIQWLNKKTGETYRLPTAEEWKYAALAGTPTKYYWGDKVGNNNANCGACGSQWSGKQTAPVASFKPNQFGLYDMLGNVWEWVSSCEPIRLRGSQKCMKYFFLGGDWKTSAEDFDPKHFGSMGPMIGRAYDIGFRVAK